MKLIDTSNWIHFLRGSNPEISAVVRHLISIGEAGICPIIAAELWNGVRNDNERIAIEKIEQATTFFGFSEEVWRKSYALASGCRREGITAPLPDILISACGLHHGLDIYHSDGHYRSVLPLGRMLFTS